MYDMLNTTKPDRPKLPTLTIEPCKQRTRHSTGAAISMKTQTQRRSSAVKPLLAYCENDVTRYLSERMGDRLDALEAGDLYTVASLSSTWLAMVATGEITPKAPIDDALGVLDVNALLSFGATDGRKIVWLLRVFDDAIARGLGIATLSALAIAAPQYAAERMQSARQNQSDALAREFYRQIVNRGIAQFLYQKGIGDELLTAYVKTKAKVETGNWNLSQAETQILQRVHSSVSLQELGYALSAALEEVG